MSVEQTSIKILKPEIELNNVKDKRQFVKKLLTKQNKDEDDVEQYYKQKKKFISKKDTVPFMDEDEVEQYYNQKKKFVYKGSSNSENNCSSHTKQIENLTKRIGQIETQKNTKGISYNLSHKITMLENRIEELEESNMWMSNIIHNKHSNFGPKPRQQNYKRRYYYN